MAKQDVGVANQDRPDHRKLRRFESEAKKIMRNGKTVGAGSVIVDIPGSGIKTFNLSDAMAGIVNVLMEKAEQAAARATA